MASESLLPPNATPLELALEGTLCRPEFVPNQVLWDPDLAPAEVLPWLAHSLSVDAWEPTWTEETRRRVIASSVAIHRIKGTRASIRAALEAAGYGDAIIVEGGNAVLYDGATLQDGSETHGTAGVWAEYSIYLSRPISLGQAAEVRRLLGRVAPVRCRLRSLDYREVALLYDAATLHDGTYSHGEA